MPTTDQVASKEQFSIRIKAASFWLPLEKPPSRSRGLRAGNPKARTGCRTCKIRRVKCDEGQPGCQRCQKYGTECGGYCLPREKSTTPPQRVTFTAKIFPKNQRQIPRLSQIPSMHAIYSGPRFENEQECRYFRDYCDETSLRITGAFHSSLWKILIPQASEAEPFVRHATVAVGALTRLSKDRKKRLGVDASVSSSKTDSTYALKKYDESLRGMRKAIARGGHDVRKLLIACLLVFCFETLQGNFASAISHAERGLIVFYQSVSITKRQVASKSPIAAKSLEKHMMEGDLMHAYAGLDLYIIFWRDTRSEHIHRATIAHQNMHISKMPIVFTDIQEARGFWFMIMRRNYHFLKIASMSAATNAPKTVIGNDENPLKSSSSAMECIMTSPGRPSLSLRAEYERYSEELRRCVHACSALFEDIQRRGTRLERLLVDMLSMHAKVTNIVLTGAFLSSELDYDSFLPDFKEILSVAQAIHPLLLELAEGSGGFHYGYGVNYPLFLIGLRCRDSSTRNAAIQLLDSQEHREGIWDAKVSASIAGWVRDFEQKGMDRFGFVAESQRIFLARCHLDMADRKAFVRAAQRIEGSLSLMTALIAW